MLRRRSDCLLGVGRKAGYAANEGRSLCYRGASYFLGCVGQGEIDCDIGGRQ